jgi:hypothetical protein
MHMGVRGAARGMAAAVLAWACAVEGSVALGVTTAFQAPPRPPRPYLLRTHARAPARGCTPRASLPPARRARTAPAHGASGTIGGQAVRGVRLRSQAGVLGMRSSSSPLIDEIFATPGRCISALYPRLLRAPCGDYDAARTVLPVYVLSAPT